MIWSNSFAQSKKYTEHTVVVGETVSSIAKKYNTSIESIYNLNPDTRNGLQLNKVVLIPKSDLKLGVTKASVKPQTHEVKTKETKYSISKLYNISIEELETLNPIIAATGLQQGQILQLIKAKNSELKPTKIVKKEVLIQNGVVIHEVQPKETKFGIAAKYGISIEELEKQNPEIATNLPIGFKLKINKTSGLEKKPIEVVKIDTTKTKITAIATPKQTELIDYLVKTGETLYSLTKKFNLTETALLILNPDLKEGLKEGMTIKVPSNTVFIKEVQNNYKDLSKTLKRNNRKELVLFLPFNASRIQNDSINSVAERFKKDKFLNMTLDFYSGVLMAVDSAKVLNLNINIKIYDSQETKNSTSALANINAKNLENTDVVIGPFYQVNVEKVADALSDKNIPVISPLSKENGKSFKNLYQSMPTLEATKNAIFDFMRTKNGNIVAIIDAKKELSKIYFDENQSEIKRIGFNDKGAIVTDSIKKHLIKDRLNYVVMESERTSVIMATTTILSNLMKEFQIQLVILEPNETLDFEEIALSRLTKLKMLYPSVANENNSIEAKKFEKLFKKKNKVYPNQYAVRGFDLTFDTLLRLSQDQTFAETIDNSATEQIESKFDYVSKAATGFANKGIFILYYDTDLNIKKAE